MGVFFSVRGSSQEEFEEFYKESLYSDECQTHMNSSYSGLVVQQSTCDQFLVVGFESNRVTIQHAENILFSILYHSTITSNTSRLYTAVDISLKGSHRPLLNRIKVNFHLPHLDSAHEIHVESHSKLACGGLYSKWNILPSLNENKLVSFISKRAPEADCNYVDTRELTLVKAKTSRWCQSLGDPMSSAQVGATAKTDAADLQSAGPAKQDLIGKNAKVIIAFLLSTFVAALIIVTTICLHQRKVYQQSDCGNSVCMDINCRAISLVPSSETSDRLSAVSAVDAPEAAEVRLDESVIDLDESPGRDIPHTEIVVGYMTYNPPQGKLICSELCSLIN